MRPGDLIPSIMAIANVYTDHIQFDGLTDNICVPSAFPFVLSADVFCPKLVLQGGPSPNHATVIRLLKFVAWDVLHVMLHNMKGH